MWSALPTSQYYGGSAPSRPDQLTTHPARSSPAGYRTVERDRDGSRVHLSPIDEGGAQLDPGGPWPHAADLQARLPSAPDGRWAGGCLETEQPRTACRPTSARLESVPANEASNAGSSRAPSRHARRARTIWQCWHVPTSSGLLPPFPAPPGSGCPQLHRPAATVRRRRSLTSVR